jgi:DNA-binding transcriptional MerR regulator
MEKLLPSIPAKRYFTIGEVGDLCGVKPHVLRYWEQEFNQLRPMKRRGNRRYYQHHEVLMIRRIRDLLYDQGFTISGARNKIQELIQADRELKKSGLDVLDGLDTPSDLELDASPFEFSDLDAEGLNGTNSDQTPMQLIRRELQEISYLLGSEDRSKS